jgi:hypothetical protein
VTHVVTEAVIVCERTMTTFTGVKWVRPLRRSPGAFPRLEFFIAEGTAVSSPLLQMRSLFFRSIRNACALSLPASLSHNLVHNRCEKIVLVRRGYSEKC